ncbi:MAG: DMT family transporter [Lachnospiraceae bacterium]|nr:DMT family transporter [Lachnospiraceae bacterium]
MEETKRKNQTKNVLIELIAVLFLASAGIFVRRSTLSPINTGLWRMIFALPFLFILAFKDLMKISGKDIILSIFSGIFLAGDLVFFNLALVNTSMANTNLFTNLTAFIIVPVSHFVFKEQISKNYLIGLFITLAGVALLVLGKNSPSSSNYIGDLCAVGACIFYSFYMLTTYRLRDRLESSVILFIGAFGTIIALLIVCGIREGLQYPKTLGEFLNLLLFAICMQVIGQNLLAYCQGKISINLSIAITLLQPGIAAIYSFLFFGERLTIMELCGMAVVVTGVYICKRQFS